MEDFVMRSITIEGTHRMFSVHRMRTSKGGASITIKSFRGGDIIFSVDENEQKDENKLLYEEYARELGEILIRIANNPCKLPEVKE
jgi:hypothetical protein